MPPSFGVVCLAAQQLEQPSLPALNLNQMGLGKTAHTAEPRAPIPSFVLFLTEP